MIVHALDAFNIPIAAEWSVKAKNKVLPYIAKSKTAPSSARKRFIFFINMDPFYKGRKNFSCKFAICPILYMETVKKSNTDSLKKLKNGI